jgi:hypothetical protein
MQKIKHKKISSLQMDDITVNIYINFVHIIDITDLFETIHFIYYQGKKHIFMSNKPLLEFINKKIILCNEQ